MPQASTARRRKTSLANDSAKRLTPASFHVYVRALDQSTPSFHRGEPGANVQKAPPVWRVALLLATLVIGLILLNNWQYAFHEELYENGDWAANSLLVKDATHSALLHGHYSRWAFYHPGPAFLDTLALGEAVFFNWLHVVPQPYNGQFIAIVTAMALFFSLAVSVFAGRLGRERGGYVFFVPLALLFAVWHYGSVERGGAFYDSWPAFPPVLTFLCLLVAVASTASGSGRELPLIALAGGWLVHNHVAQPLFVVPLTLLGYAGFVWSCRRAETDVRPRSRFWSLGAGWRAFPRAHLVAAAILALFILPLCIDALHGRDSNLARILAHLRTVHQPPRKVLRSFCYFLTFGSYTQYKAGEPYFGSYSTRGMLDFVTLHWRAYSGWLLALCVPPILFAVSRRRAAQVPGADGTRPAPSTFVPWFYVTLAAAFALTLVWGMKQDGSMYYFNSFFNYSIYYAVALGLAGSLAVFLQTLTAGGGDTAARRVICVALWIGAGVAALDKAPQCKALAGDEAADRAAAQSVRLAAAATLPAGAVCFLDCDPWAFWPSAITVALQLDRMGYRVRVDDAWGIMFGANRTLAGNPVDLSRPLPRWRIVPISRDPTRLGRWPVLMDCAIEVMPLLDIDPAGGRIRLGDKNVVGYIVYGLPPTDGDWTWSDERNALIQFRPLPLAADARGVDVVFDAWSFYKPGSPESQRMETIFNGVTLETVHLPVNLASPEKPTVHIDAALWRAAVAQGGAVLQLRFPDAKSPAEVGLGTDARPLGGGFRSIEFEPTVPSPVAATP